mmetsp:Transcript_22001/g.51185  ORF Transcript_22001/g.51185 Transcript_22001/m.51185 type:complete len:91 (+) Transcript_22001:189-461(+)
MTTAGGGVNVREGLGLCDISSFLDGTCEGCGKSNLQGCGCCPFVVSPSGYSRAGDGRSQHTHTNTHTQLEHFFLRTEHLLAPVGPKQTNS